MKKKILTFMLSLCFILPCAFFMTACGGGDDKPEDKYATIKLYSTDNQLYTSSTQNGNHVTSDYDETFSIDNKKFEGGEDIKYSFTMNRALSYSQNNVSVIEESGKSFNYSVNVTYKSLTQQCVEVVITNYANNSSFVIDLIESTTPIKVSQDLDIGYHIRIHDNYDLQIGYDALNALDNIAVYSDVAERFVSMADIKKYEKFRRDYEVFTYDAAVAKWDELVEEGEEDLSAYINPRYAQLGIIDNSATDFKVYVSFGANGYNPYAKDFVTNLVSVRESYHRDFEDSYLHLDFDPVVTTHNGVKCYAYTLPVSKVHNLNEESYVALHYANDISSIDIGTEAEIVEECEFYTTGHRFISNKATINVENLEFYFTLSEMSVNGGEKEYFNFYEDKNLEDEVKYTITHSDNSLIDFSKFQPQVGTYKATYDSTNDVYYLTLPSNVYPSQTGNALYFELKVAPLFTQVSEIFNATAQKVNYKVIVNELEMFSALDLGLDEWQTYNYQLFASDLSADGKTQNVELLTSDTMLNETKHFELNLDILFSIYDSITLDISFAGITYSNVLIDFKEVINKENYNFYLVYDESKSSYSLHTDAITESPSGTYIEFHKDGASKVTLANIYLDESKTFTTTDTVVINLKQAERGTAKVKFTGTVMNGQNAIGQFNITSLIVKQGGVEIQKVGDYYILARGVEFEATFTFDSLEQYMENVSSSSEWPWVALYDVNDEALHTPVENLAEKVDGDAFLNETITIKATVNSIAAYDGIADYVVVDYQLSVDYWG